MGFLAYARNRLCNLWECPTTEIATPSARNDIPLSSLRGAQRFASQVLATKEAMFNDIEGNSKAVGYGVKAGTL